MMGDHGDDLIDMILLGEFDDFELEDEGGRPPRDVRCRDCLSDEVYWAQDRNGKWIMYDFRTSKRHVCNAKVLSARRLDAFEDES